MKAYIGRGRCRLYSAMRYGVAQGGAKEERYKTRDRRTELWGLCEKQKKEDDV